MTRSTHTPVVPSLADRGRPTGARRTVGYHRHLMVVRIALFATLWLVAGCSAASTGGSPSGSPDGGASSTGAAGSLEPASIQPSQEPTPSPGPNDLSAAFVDPVVADAARLASVPVEAVTVQSAESMTFPDGGLGCPVPGMLYTQVMTEGYKIVVVAGGTTYDYRGTAPGKFRLCTPLK
jgi:hypothetical protein